jgi:D-alanyl-D-alanine carboxypeptidase/D-alanyl-D-alanine-endopeptidase (penicillin-binding protein 4)
MRVPRLHPSNRRTPARPVSLGIGLMLLALLALMGGGMPVRALAQSPTTANEGTTADAPALPPSVADALASAALAPAAVSMLVLPAEGGPPLLALAADQPRPAASVMKLFTTGAALLTLGPAHTWHTDAGLGGPLGADGRLAGPLYLRGGGDPALKLEQLALWMQEWRAAGLRHIAGDIVVDRGAFALPPHDPAAFDDRPLKPYNAGPDALLLNHQAVRLRFAPDATDPTRARVSLSPPLAGVSLDAQVSLTPPTTDEALRCGDWRAGLHLDLRPDAPPTAGAPVGSRPWRVAVAGRYPADCGTQDWPLLWQGDGPGDHAARLLTQAWQAAGGTLDGAVQDGAWPAEVPVWQSWTSPPLAEVVRDINKYSNNVMARELFLALAPAAPATLDAARTALAQAVQGATRRPDGQTPCTDAAWRIDNGSGLSREARTSATCLAAWMRHLWHSTVMPEWLASLPINGVDGTTRRWLGADGRAHVKTGSLDGVAAMAGIVDADSDQRLIVIAFVQDARAGRARPAFDALLDWAMHGGLRPALPDGPAGGGQGPVR